MKKSTKKSLLAFISLILLASLLCSCFAGCSLFEKDKQPNDSANLDNSPPDDPNTPNPPSAPAAGNPELEKPSEERNDFINTLGGVSETYTGSVSEKSYRSANDAAQAFVEIEVAGEKNAVISETKSNGNLTQNQISALNIPTDFQQGLQSVEEIEVSYTLEADTTKTASTNNTKKVKVYIIKYATDWKYFTPMPIKGDTVTKSYYDSVFNMEKYKNCTLNSTSKIKIHAQGLDESPVNSDIEITELIKYAGDKIYMELSMSSPDDSESTKTCAYLETVNGKLKCYIKIDGLYDWAEADLTTVGFSSLEEITPFYDQYLDYTYFTKTSYGFAVADENAKQYANAVMQESGLGDILGDQGTITMDMFAEYYVSQGVLSGMRTDIDIDLNLSVEDESLVLEEKMVTIISCTDYGTTVVEKPFT